MNVITIIMVKVISDAAILNYIVIILFGGKTIFILYLFTNLSPAPFVASIFRLFMELMASDCAAGLFTVGTCKQLFGDT
jgi:hypothetical protein